MARAESYLFILAVLLIAVAYYVGLTTDAKAVASGVNSILQTSTGRDASNKFASYPGQA